MLSNPIFWVGFGLGALTHGFVIIAIVSIYVQTRGPFLVGPPEPPDKEE